MAKIKSSSILIIPPLLLILSCFRMPADDPLPILGWSPERRLDIRRLASAGFTLVLSPPGQSHRARPVLDLADSLGLRVVIGDGRLEKILSGGDSLLNRLDSVALEHQHHGLWGYFLRMMPRSDEFARLAVVQKYLRSRDPQHLTFICVQPDQHDYGEYLRLYIDRVAPDLVCFNRDCLQDGCLNEGSYSILETVRRIALKHELTFWAPVATPLESRASVSELRLQVHAGLACGARGLFYNLGSAEWGAPVWERIGAMNQQVNRLSPVLKNLTSTGIYFTGSIPPDCRGLPSKGPLLSIEGGSMIVGAFSGKERDTYLFIVNRDIFSGVRPRLLFSRSVRRFVELGGTRKTGIRHEWMRRERDRTLAVLFKAGEGRLFRIDVY